ncbi:MAG: class I SAM-dependent methyltransferase [Planctomycetota bacterium]
MTTTLSAIDAVRAHRERVYGAGEVRSRGGEPFAIVPDGLSEACGRWLLEAAEREGALRTIETGFAFGLSGLWLVEGALRGAAARGVDAGGMSHTAIDHSQARAYRDAGRLAFEDAGIGDRLTVVERRSIEALPMLFEAGERFDLGFVDGSHHFDHALIDISFMLRLVRPGGLIVVDDMGLPGRTAAFDFARRNLPVTVELPEDTEARRMGVLRIDAEGIAADRRRWDEFHPFWAGEGEMPMPGR